MQIEYKKDIQSAIEHWDNFWEISACDRPCISVVAPESGGTPAPALPPTPEDYWLDPDYICELMIHSVSNTYWGGDAIPTQMLHPLMSGWFLGCSKYSSYEYSTIWLDAFMENIEDISKYVHFTEDPLFSRIEVLVDRMLDAAEGRCIVGYPAPMCINDLLPMAMGAENLLMELADNPEKSRKAVVEMWEKWYEGYETFQNMIYSRQQGHFWGWPGLWSTKNATLTQSDMSCNIGPSDFENFVGAELDLLGEKFERIWYHLDGPGAIKHLPALLAKPYIKIIQYVPGAGQPPNGPDWIDLYKEVQAAGRGLDLDVPIENFDYLLRNLKPEGLALRTYVGTPEEADALVEKSYNMSGKDA